MRSIRIPTLLTSQHAHSVGYSSSRQQLLPDHRTHNTQSTLIAPVTSPLATDIHLGNLIVRAPRTAKGDDNMTPTCWSKYVIWWLQRLPGAYIPSETESKNKGCIISKAPGLQIAVLTHSWSYVNLKKKKKKKYQEFRHMVQWSAPQHQFCERFGRTCVHLPA